MQLLILSLSMLHQTFTFCSDFAKNVSQSKNCVLLLKFSAYLYLLLSCLMLHAMCVNLWLYLWPGVSMCYVYLWPVYLLFTSSGSAATRIYEYMYLFISSGRKCQLANYRFCMYCIIAYVCILRLLTTNVGIFPRKGKID